MSVYGIEDEGARPAETTEGDANVESGPAEEAQLAPPTPEELADLRAKAAERDEYLDLLKRARADFANYQKRVAEDRKKWSAVAQRELLARLMAATDHCRLSAEKSKSDDSAESLRDCIGLIWAEFEKFLDSSGVKFVPTTGQPFDPHRHEAVFVQERDDLPDSTIIDEIRPGYEFAGQVIRSAQVVVSKRPKPPAPPSVDNEGSEQPPGAESSGESEFDEGSEGAAG